MPAPRSVITLDEACDLTRTGDVWLFRGSSGADRAIRSLTNAPVNHVGMAIVVDDLPPLMWHAELGRALPDLWSGTHQRGVQLHDLRAAVTHWSERYHQRAWLRQLHGPTPATPGAAAQLSGLEDAALRTVARLDGTPFPSTARLAGRWFRGRLPRLRLPRLPDVRLPWRGPDAPEVPDEQPSGAGLETAYCAEVVAVTYEEMGLLPGGRLPNWYDPGRFWSGDDLDLVDGFHLGREIAVDVPHDRSNRTTA